MKRGDYEAASRAFERSLALEFRAGTLLNLALCEEKLGRLLSARRRYAEFMRAAPPDDDRREGVAERERDVTSRLGRLEFAPRAEVTAPRISVDGRSVAEEEWTSGVELDPGEHVLVVQFEGRPRHREVFTVAEGQRIGRSFDEAHSPPQADAAKAPTVPDIRPVPDRSHPGGRRYPFLGYAAMGLGVAGFVTSAVTAALAVQKHEMVQRHCDGAICDPAGFEANEAGKDLLVVSTVSFLVGVAGVGSGAALYFTLPRASSNDAFAVGVRGTL